MHPSTLERGRMFHGPILRILRLRCCLVPYLVRCPLSWSVGLSHASLLTVVYVPSVACPFASLHEWTVGWDVESIHVAWIGFPTRPEASTTRRTPSFLWAHVSSHTRSIGRGGGRGRSGPGTCAHARNEAEACRNSRTTASPRPTDRKCRWRWKRWRSRTKPRPSTS